MDNANLTLNDCLQAHVGRLIHALEEQEPPRTYGDILKAARALIAVKKAIDLIYKTLKGVDLDIALPADGRKREDAAAPTLNRQMRRLMEAKSRKRG